MTTIHSTGLVPDSELQDTDIWGNVPLMSFIEEDEGEEKEAPEDVSGADEDEGQPEVEPSSRDVLVDPEDEGDDEAAYEALTSPEGGGLSPGEAQAMIDYMRPVSEEEEELNNDPMFRDLRWVDSPSHTDELLAKTKGTRAMSDFMLDASYGDDMKDEEGAERHDSDRTGTWNPTDLAKEGPGGGLCTGFMVKPSRFAMIAMPDEPKSMPTGSNQSLINARNAKYTIVSGLNYTLVNEHASWLEEQDRKAGIAIRPKAYYLNISRLWANSQMQKAKLPTTIRGDFSGSHSDLIGAAIAVLEGTQSVRQADDTLGGWGWNPISNLKSLAKSSLNPLNVTKKLYKYGKKGVTTSLKYAKKAVMLPLTIAQKIALAPLKKIISKFTGKMVNKRAADLAKQRGLKAPGAAERSDALNWAKKFIRSKTPYGSAITSLMGSESGYYNVDISFGDAHTDVMGLGKAGIAGLILLGPIGLIALLTGLVKTGGGGGAAAAPAGEGGEGEGEGEGAEGGEGAAEGGEGAAEGGEGAAADDSAQGWGFPKPWKHFGHKITLEQIARLSPARRAKVQQALRSGRLRLG
jgi:hypothetical protein